MKTVIYAKAPEGYPVAGEHLKTVEREKPTLGDGEVLLKMKYCSIDPYQRPRMRDPSVKSYFPAFQYDAPIDNHGVGEIVESKNEEKFPVGKLVFCPGLAWAEYSVLPKQLQPAAKVLDNAHNIPLSNFLGAVGMPGMTAYTSFYEIGKPQKGETIFISAASGAVGQIVGQLAKREGLRVVGSAGSDEKVAYLKEIGFDAAFNYKTEENSEATLRKYCPDGIDIYFDNVGGKTLESAISASNKLGRIICCGMISQYNLPASELYGVKNLMLLVGRSITMRGFVVSDFWQKYQTEFYTNMEKWIADGDIKTREDIAQGLDNGIDLFVGMLKGKNFGKAMIEV
ncbi:hypothetical protein PYCC9005_004116 [Savitreella phatthalungensis]